MPKNVIASLYALLLLTFSFTASLAQPLPFVAVYFDPGLSTETSACPNAPTGTVQQTLYVAALNFNKPGIVGVEFMVDYPPELQWMSEIYPTPETSSVTGTTATGLAIEFNPAVDGFSPIVIAEVTALWQCDDCTGHQNTPMKVVPHPDSGVIRGLGFSVLPAPIEIPAAGLTALICPTIPVAETTWGRVKALYQ